MPVTAADRAAAIIADQGAIDAARALSARDCGAMQSEMRHARQEYLAEAFAAHRTEQSALDKHTFITCVAGDGPTPYLKVHFSNLADCHAAHDALLGTQK